MSSRLVKLGAAPAQDTRMVSAATFFTSPTSAATSKLSSAPRLSTFTPAMNPASSARRFNDTTMLPFSSRSSGVGSAGGVPSLACAPLGPWLGASGEAWKFTASGMGPWACFARCFRHGVSHSVHVGVVR